MNDLSDWYEVQLTINFDAFFKSSARKRKKEPT